MENMQGNSTDTFETRVRNLISLLKAAGTLAGLLCIIYGFIYIRDLFETIHQGVKNPEFFSETISKWSNVLGGTETLSFVIDGQKVTCDRILALIFICAGLFLLSWICLNLMITGARVISWASSGQPDKKDS